LQLRRLDALWRLLLMQVAVAAGVFLVVARMLIPWLWAQPLLAEKIMGACLLRSWCGVPCPFCGGTRAVVAAAHGDWAGSLLQHPIAALLVAGAVMVGIWTGLSAATGYDLGLTRSIRYLRPWLSWSGLTAAVLVTWFAKLATDLIARQ
jgi:hypothetical protein